MSRTGWSLSVVVMGFLALPALAALGQQSDPPSQPQPLAPPSNPLNRVPVLRRADQFSLTADFEYFEPGAGFDRQDRDIDLQVLRAAAAAHYRSGWEFQLDALALRAHGTEVYPNAPPVPSNSLAIGAGPMARWNLLDLSRFRLFADGLGDLILNDRNFPPHGSSYNFFLRAGGGVSYRVSNSWWIEAALRDAHISNGQGIESANPTWNGRGLILGLRRTLWSEPTAPQTAMPPESDAPPQPAWITSSEVYWAVPGTNFQVANPIHQIRVFRISRSWPVPKAFEFQFGGLIGNPPHIVQDDEIAGLGPTLRRSFLQTRQFHLFTDAGADFLQLGSRAYVVPLGGVAYGSFLRAGAGAGFHVHGAYWLDAGYRWNHLTSAFGSGGSNYTPWSGQGVVLALRHTLQR